jgi:hypothetical protein
MLVIQSLRSKNQMEAGSTVNDDCQRNKESETEKKDNDYCRRRSPSREKGEKSTVCPCVHEGWGEYETGQVHTGAMP